MNKLGIIGQIGMMFIAPHIGAFAMKGLSALGSGFMAGLSNAGTLGKFAHGVLSNAANLAKTGISGVRTITDTIGGVIADSTRQVASKLTGGYIKPLQHATAGTFESQSWYGKILENAQARGNAGFKKTMQLASDTGREFTASLPGGEKYAPKYEKFTDPDARFFKTRSREVAYDSANKSLLEASPEFKGVTEAAKRPVLTGQQGAGDVMYGTQAGAVSPEVVAPESLSIKEGAGADFFSDPSSLQVTPDDLKVDSAGLTTGSITPTEEGGFVKRSFESMVPTSEDVGSAAKTAATQMAMNLLDKKPDPLLPGAPPPRTSYDEIFASTIGAVGSGQGLGQFGTEEPIAEDQVAMNNFLGFNQGDTYWNNQFNTRTMVQQQQQSPTQFIGSFV